MSKSTFIILRFGSTKPPSTFKILVISFSEEYEKAVLKPKKPRVKKQVVKESSSDSEAPAEELEISIPSIQQSFLPQVDGGTDDSDRLFLLSFLPEMRQLPPKIKMWARAQVARVMQVKL